MGGTSELNAFLRAREDAGLGCEGLGGVGENRCENHGGGGGLVTQSCPTLVTPQTSARQAPLSMGFSRQEFWSGLPFPSPGDLPNLGIEPGSPALQADDLLNELNMENQVKWQVSLLWPAWSHG